MLFKGGRGDGSSEIDGNVVPDDCINCWTIESLPVLSEEDAEDQEADRLAVVCFTRRVALVAKRRA